MWAVCKTFAFCLLFIAANVDISRGTCFMTGKHELNCQLDDIKEFKNFKNVNSLKIRSMMNELPKDALKSFGNLTHVDLSNGALKRIEPDAFSHLKHLVSLNLAGNQIEIIKPGAFKNLNQLISLNLRKNAIKQLPQELLNLKNLQHIDLTGNPLQCNCLTLEVRDTLIKKNVKISKKVLCAGPFGIKGVPLIKPETSLVCLFDDKDMQMDQPMLNEEEDSDDDDYVDYEEDSKKIDDASIKNATESITPNYQLQSSTTASTPNNTKTGEDMFIDFEDGDKRTKNRTSTMSSDNFEEGSGDMDDEGSGLEGSGIEMLPHINWEEIQEENSVDNTSPSGDTSSTTQSESLFDILINALWTTAAPEVKKISELEEEQFIHVTTPTPVEKVDPRIYTNNEIDSSSSPEPKPTKESDKFINIIQNQSDRINESLSHSSKKGLASYVVLGVLLGVLAGLIAFAAYKGDFCRDKRKHSNIENGTEMKDMHKSLLEQNTIVPKVASNGNTEVAPLMCSKQEDGKIIENGHKIDDVDGCDPIKPPRKSMNLSEGGLMINGTNFSDGYKPSVSPGAQRVKITLQENPDSVPKTPVLITRLKQDDNLVKAS